MTDNSSPRSHKPLLRNTTMALALLMLGCVLASAQSQSSNSGQGLAGTWRVQVSLYNCDTKAPLGPPFQSMLSFHNGGTLSGTTANPVFAPGQRTSDYGIWSYDGDQSYSAKSEAYILFAAGPFARGTQRITQTIKVNEDQFTSAASVQFFDANHVQVMAACAAAVGQRFN